MPKIEFVEPKYHHSLSMVARCIVDGCAKKARFCEPGTKFASVCAYHATRVAFARYYVRFTDICAAEGCFNMRVHSRDIKLCKNHFGAQRALPWNSAEPQRLALTPVLPYPEELAHPEPLNRAADSECLWQFFVLLCLSREHCFDEGALGCRE